MLYLYTLVEASKSIRQKYPNIVPDPKAFVSGQVAPAAYLLWMINETGKMTNPEVASRSIGWILAHMELNGFWDDNTSRNLLRKDAFASDFQL